VLAQMADRGSAASVAIDTLLIRPARRKEGYDLELMAQGAAGWE